MVSAYYVCCLYLNELEMTSIKEARTMNTNLTASPAQIENQIKPGVYVRPLRVVLCTKKLHFVSRKWLKEN